MSADKVELRGLAPRELAEALDALALANAMTRHDYSLHVLTLHVKAELAKSSLIHRVLQGNPLLVESSGRGVE